MSFRIKFWGVRGSIACPSPNHVVYGGNTSCIEVNVGGQHFILDAGTGIRGLGHDFLQRNLRRSAILLSHTHWDHINGFPFFAPAFRADCTFSVHAGHLAGLGGVENVLASQMANPLFPVPLSALQAKLEFHDFEAGDVLTFGDVRVRTAPLNHPNGATGYRLEHGGTSACYVTDTEHVPGQTNETIVELIRDADLVIYDCTYTEDEFQDRIGWGHSTWQEGIRLCKLAGAKRLAIFHHDPDHDDEFMERVEREARNQWGGALVARDNMELTLA